MTKIYRKLTKEQKLRGVIFSSTLVFDDKNEYRQETTIHEVTKDMDSQEQERRIKNLKDDSFFNNSHYKFNLIRQ